MAFWDSKAQRIVRFPPERATGDWVRMDCGCCAGLQWGGEEPRECHNCKGWGSVYVHIPSRRLAEWPGGPFLGAMTRTEAENVLKRVDEAKKRVRGK